MLMKLCPGDWGNQLEKMNIMVDEDNGRAAGMVKGRLHKFRPFSINEIRKNVGCLVPDPTFGLGGSRLWDKEEEQKIKGNKCYIYSIRVRVNLYEVCVYSILFIVLFIIL